MNYEQAERFLKLLKEEVGVVIEADDADNLVNIFKSGDGRLLVDTKYTLSRDSSVHHVYAIYVADDSVTFIAGKNSSTQGFVTSGVNVVDLSEMINVSFNNNAYKFTSRTGVVTDISFSTGCRDIADAAIAVMKEFKKSKRRES